MLHRHSLLLAFLAVALLCAACEDLEGPDLTSHRYVYYAVNGTNSASESGVFRYSVADAARNKMDDGNADYCTRVASNGIVLYEFNDQSHRLYGICEGGAIIPVPFPQSPDPAFEFIYRIPPRMDLSADGHHAAYAVDLVPAGVTSPVSSRSHLVVFDCAQWVMTLVDIDSLLVDSYTVQKLRAGFIAGNHLLINRAGTRVWFTAGLIANNAGSDTTGYVLAEWSSEGLRILENPAPAPLEPLGYNEYTSTLVYQYGSVAYARRLSFAHQTVFEAEDPSDIHPWQFGTDLDICARWEDDGISIRKATDGSLVWRIVDKEAFENAGGGSYEYGEQNSLAISPDGKWLVVTLSHPGVEDRCDIFTLRSNGKELKILDTDVPVGFPTISSQIQD